MKNSIDYRKSVDTIDEGLMALNLLRTGVSFPLELLEEILNILDFLSLAEKPQYEDLLYDNRVTISKECLKSIHDKIKDLKFPVDDIEKTKELLRKTSGNISTAEMDSLESYLIEFSQPLWITTISNCENG